MNRLESTGRGVKRRLGLTDRSTLVKAVRPAYNLALNIFYGRRGLERVLNGEESVRVRPAYRSYVHEDCELQVYRCLKKLVKPGSVVLDVGAHLGQFAIVMARWVGATGKVFAFEPTAATRVALSDHLILNDVADRVEIVEQAVSDAVGEAPFYVLSISPENALNPVHSRLGPAQEMRVPVTTIDCFCEQRCISPTLLKMDIEGFEIHALRGAKETLVRHRPAVVVELHPINWTEIGESPATAAAILRELGYRAAPLESQTEPLAECGHCLLEPA